MALTAYVDAKVFPSPTDPVIEDATVLVKDGLIVGVGPRLKLKIPKGANIVHCDGLVIVAGLWNSHVHLYTPEWLNAATAPPDRLSQQLTSTFLRYGFVHVVDLGSFLANTLALRKRIDEGEVRGPTILTAGEPLYPAGGVPEAAKQFNLPEAASPEQAAQWARKQLANGADVLKVFTGAGYSGPITIMSPEIVQAVVAEAHSRGKLVFAHPQTVAGRQAAVAGGVDVLAHTPDPSGEDNSIMLEALKAHGTVVIPTLKLWGVDVSPDQRERVVNNGVSEIRAFNAIGGTIIFGTDVGYMPDTDPTDEYRLMTRAGMSFQQILASLTTSPAHLFGLADRTGRISPGFDADLVFLGSDPSVDTTAFANVKRALLRGRILFDLPPVSGH
jgi:imidazolonepropionase-like amidohydrolase